jgi:hypothetical protein
MLVDYLSDIYTKSAVTTLQNPGYNQVYVLYDRVTIPFSNFFKDGSPMEVLDKPIEIHNNWTDDGGNPVTTQVAF